MPPVPLSMRGLQRRIGMHLHSREQELRAICAPGFEAVCAREIAALPQVRTVTPGTGGVSFCGGFDLVYHANLRVRCAVRILLRIAQFRASSYPELYNKCRRIAWERYLGFNGSVALHCSSRSSRLHHTAHIAQAVSDAAAAVMQPLGVTLSHTPRAALTLFVRMENDTCTLSIDSSGELLHKRGYRASAGGAAPLRETSAAALLLEQEPARFTTMLDPFCGSATFLMEGAQILAQHAPGLNREFAFSHWPAFEARKWEYLRAAAKSEQCLPRRPVTLVGGDINPGQLAHARRCIGAGATGPLSIVLYRGDACRPPLTLAGEALLCSNLPWGKRSAPGGELRELYRRFGTMLRHKGWSYLLVVPDLPGVWNLLGVRPQTVRRFSSGGLAVQAGWGKGQRKGNRCSSGQRATSK